MAIPSDRLESWTHQGAITTSKKTHETVREALETVGSPVRDRILDGTVDVYLQGSYRNDTNIIGDSDVDVVVELTTTFGYDLFMLEPPAEQHFHKAYTTATYLWDQFRADVLSVLEDYYGDDLIEEGPNCIKVAPTSNTLAADVLVCTTYRKYYEFKGLADQDYVEGIQFYTRPQRRRVVNYPKQHYANGVKKQAATSDRFKATARMFKNARNYLIDAGELPSDIAPSYFLQCLLYNVPNDQFTSSNELTYLNVVLWLADAPMEELCCQNREALLFGDTPEHWSIPNARQLVGKLAHLWSEWPL